MSRIVALDTTDIRFPTSLSLDGSDAMNPDPDYSAAYVIVRTGRRRRHRGARVRLHDRPRQRRAGRAIDALAGHLVGREIEPLLDDMGSTFRDIIGDSQLRWLGPEKGVMHMAIGAVINALWDIKAKRAGLPLWQLLARMTPEELVDLVDFRYLTNALTPEDALEILRAAEPGRAEREQQLLATGYPGYTTSPGWLGYSDESSNASPARPWPTASPRSSSRSAPTSTTTSAASARRGGVRTRLPIAIDANQRWEVVGGDRVGERARPSSIPPGSRSPRAPTTCSATPRSPGGVAPIRVATGSTRRTCHLQAAAAGRRHLGHADRRRARGRGEREHREPAARRQVRRARVPARRWCRPVRGGAAPVYVDSRRGHGHPRGPHDRVRRPPARALRRAH